MPCVKPEIAGMGPAEEERAMLSLTRWNPFVEMNSLHQELDKALRWSPDRVPGESDRSWVPATEVASDNDGWKLRMALPGIDPKDVSVNLNGDELTITGERKQEPTDRHVSEFGYGRFERRFTMPVSVAADQVSATFEHGMLELMLPVTEAAKPRRIEIGGATSSKAA